MEHLTVNPGDAVIPPYSGGDEDETSLLVWATDDDYVVLSLDDASRLPDVAIHKTQIGDLILAIKTVKENNGW